MTSPPSSQFIPSADGVPLLLRHAPRRGKGRWTVLLGHAMTVHSGLLGTLIAQLSEAGCDVWAGDLRGHGKSVSARNPLGHLDAETGWDRMVDDMAALARRAFDGVPVADRVMIGGVMSSQVMLSLLQRQPDLARHLVMAPPSPMRIGATRFATSFLKMRRLTHPVDRPDPQIRHHIYAFLKSALPRGSADADVISAFPDVVARVLADPAGFPTPTLGYWMAVLPGFQRPWDGIGPGELDPALRVMLISSQQDPQLRGARNAGPLIDWFARRGVPDARYHDLPQVRANPMVDAAHVPLARDVLDWLDQAAARMADPGAGMPPVAAAPVPPAAADPAEPRPMEMHQLIQLCYAALEDDSRWAELILRLSLAGEDEAQGIEEIVAAIQPHWQRAYDLQEELRRAAMLGVIYSDVIDRLDLGIALLDADHGLRHANAAFEAALAGIAAPGLPPATADRLAHLLAAQPPLTAQDDGDRPLIWQGQVIGFSLVPASLRRRGAGARGPLPRLLVLRRPQEDLSLPDQRAGLLALSYGLTGQEAQVALHLADGHDTAGVAAQLGVSEHTMRSHLKQVFAKMGVTSRPELVSRIMTSPLGWLTGDAPQTGPLPPAGPGDL